MDELRNQLKTMNRQFGFYIKHKTAMKNNLIGILDQTYPGVNTYFDSAAYERTARLTAPLGHAADDALDLDRFVVPHGHIIEEKSGSAP